MGHKQGLQCSEVRQLLGERREVVRAEVPASTAVIVFESPRRAQMSNRVVTLVSAVISSGSSESALPDRSLEHTQVGIETRPRGENVRKQGGELVERGNRRGQRRHPVVGRRPAASQHHTRTGCVGNTNRVCSAVSAVSSSGNAAKSFESMALRSDKVTPRPASTRKQTGR